MSNTTRDRTMRDLNSWSDRIGYPTAVLKAAIHRGDLIAEPPSGFERGRLYVSDAEMNRWLDAIRVAEESA